MLKSQGIRDEGQARNGCALFDLLGDWPGWLDCAHRFSRRRRCPSFLAAAAAALLLRPALSLRFFPSEVSLPGAHHIGLRRPLPLCRRGRLRRLLVRAWSSRRSRGGAARRPSGVGALLPAPPARRLRPVAPTRGGRLCAAMAGRRHAFPGARSRSPRGRRRRLPEPRRRAVAPSPPGLGRIAPAGALRLSLLARGRCRPRRSRCCSSASRLGFPPATPE